MKVIIAGSRKIKNYDLVEKAIKDSGFEVTEILSGCAGGVDELGEQYAARYNIKISYFPANWSTYGKGAGMIRNYEMSKIADALVAVWDGKSVGTKNMIDTAVNKGIPVKVTMFDDISKKRFKKQ
jgi:hypothetical protein